MDESGKSWEWSESWIYASLNPQRINGNYILKNITLNWESDSLERMIEYNA